MAAKKVKKALSLFEKLEQKTKKGMKALKEAERGVATRAGGKKAQGVQYVDKKSTPIRELGKTGLKQKGKGSRMATTPQREAVIKSGRRRIAGTAGGTGAVLIGGNIAFEANKRAKEEKAKEAKEAKEKEAKAAKEKAAKEAKAKRDAKKPKKKQRLIFGKGAKIRPFGGVLARALLGEDEDFGKERGAIDFIRLPKKKPKKKNMGGEIKKYRGGGFAKQGANARMDESLGERRGKESTKSQSMKSRRNESRGARKPSRPQSAGAAKRGWGAAIR